MDGASPNRKWFSHVINTPEHDKNVLVSARLCGNHQVKTFELAGGDALNPRLPVSLVVGLDGHVLRHVRFGFTERATTTGAQFFRQGSWRFTMRNYRRHGANKNSRADFRRRRTSTEGLLMLKITSTNRQWMTFRQTPKTEDKSRLCVSAAESRRLKHVAPPAELVPLAHRAGDGADAVDVPADANVLAVPSPHWWMQKERDEKVMMLALEGEAEEFKTKNFNCRSPVTSKSFREACSRPGYSFRKESQTFMKEMMDVARLEERWPLRFRTGARTRSTLVLAVRSKGVRRFMECWQEFVSVFN